MGKKDVVIGGGGGGGGVNCNFHQYKNVHETPLGVSMATYANVHLGSGCFSIYIGTQFSSFGLGTTIGFDQSSGD